MRRPYRPACHASANIAHAAKAATFTLAYACLAFAAVALTAAPIAKALPGYGPAALATASMGAAWLAAIAVAPAAAVWRYYRRKAGRAY